MSMFHQSKHRSAYFKSLSLVSNTPSIYDHAMGLSPDTQNCGLCMLQERQERFPCQQVLAIPTRITARAWRICRDACLDR